MAVDVLRVRAILSEGRVVSSDGYLPLDSILAWAWMRANHPELLEADNAGHGVLIEPELPLERCGEGDDWYWACSFAQYEQAQEYIGHWHKRFDADLASEYVDFLGRRGKVSGTMGRYRAYRMPLVIRVTPHIDWYCMGEAETIRDLLKLVTHIGKKASQGYGTVTEWQVERWPQDWSVYGPDGRLMRAIPGGDRTYGIRPPYWLPANWRECRMPEAVI